MPVAVDGSGPARWAATIASGASTTSASFTAPSGAVLLAGVSMDGDSGGGGNNYGTLTVSDSGTLTWTELVRRAEAEATDGGAFAWLWARTSSAVSRTVTAARSAGGATSKRTAVYLYVLTGVDSTTPFDTVGANNEAGINTDPADTANLTPTANGLLLCGATDWNAAATITSSNLTVEGAQYAGEISAVTGYRTCTNGVALNANLNPSATPQFKIAQVIARETATTLALHIGAGVPFVGGSWKQPPQGRR